MTQEIVNQIKRDCEEAAYSASRKSAVNRLLDRIGEDVSQWAADEFTQRKTDWFTILMAASRVFSHLLVILRDTEKHITGQDPIDLETLKGCTLEHLELAERHEPPH